MPKVHVSLHLYTSHIFVTVSRLWIWFWRHWLNYFIVCSCQLSTLLVGNIIRSSSIYSLLIPLYFFLCNLTQCWVQIFVFHIFPNFFEIHEFRWLLNSHVLFLGKKRLQHGIDYGTRPLCQLPSIGTRTINRARAI